MSVTEQEIAQRVQEQTQSLIDERAGPPAKVLINSSWEADMLIVEHRGRCAFAQLAFGSVALRCVLHARCSVIIVRSATSSRPTAADQLPNQGGSSVSDSASDSVPGELCGVQEQSCPCRPRTRRHRPRSARGPLHVERFVLTVVLMQWRVGTGHVLL